MIRWKGKCNNIEALQWLDVPEDAVLLREPKNLNTFMILVVILSLSLYIILEVAFILKYGRNTEIDSLYLLIGAITAILMIIPHEYIHAIAFPSDAERDIHSGIRISFILVL